MFSIVYLPTVEFIRIPKSSGLHPNSFKTKQQAVNFMRDMECYYSIVPNSYAPYFSRHLRVDRRQVPKYLLEVIEV